MQCTDLQQSVQITGTVVDVVYRFVVVVCIEQMYSGRCSVCSVRICSSRYRLGVQWWMQCTDLQQSVQIKDTVVNVVYRSVVVCIDYGYSGGCSLQICISLHRLGVQWWMQCTDLYQSAQIRGTVVDVVNRSVVVCIDQVYSGGFSVQIYSSMYRLRIQW